MGKDILRMLWMGKQGSRQGGGRGRGRGKEGRVRGEVCRGSFRGCF